MNTRPWILAASAILVVAAAVVLTRPDDSVSQDSWPDETSTPRSEAHPETVASAPGRPTQPPRATEPGSGTTPREQVRERIRHALRRRYGGSGSLGAADVDDASRSERDTELPPGNLDREYIQQTVREEVIPLVRECYDQLLETDEQSAGRVVMQFEIMGDETVGGIVDGVTLTEETELTQEDFAECVRESMASAIFDPPQGGGVVSVTYPMNFEPQPS
jgi:hypothetical protein